MVASWRRNSAKLLVGDVRAIYRDVCEHHLEQALVDHLISFRLQGACVPGLYSRLLKRRKKVEAHEKARDDMVGVSAWFMPAQWLEWVSHLECRGACEADEDQDARLHPGTPDSHLMRREIPVNFPNVDAFCQTHQPAPISEEYLHAVPASRDVNG